MDIKEAARFLNISERHLRRLIKMGAVPAEKMKVKKVIEVEVNEWQIPDEVVQNSKDALKDMSKYDHFGEWMTDKASELGISLLDLSKRTRIPLHDLEYIASQPGWLKPEAEDIEQKIASLLLRVAIQRRSGNVE